MMDDKELQFDRLWEGITPKGVNRTKALKFRQYILEHVRQMRRPLNRDTPRSIGWANFRPKLRIEKTFDVRGGHLRLGGLNK